MAGPSKGKRGRDTARVLTGFYDALYGRFGPQGWWPGQTRFEVIVGAILTQNTAWTNVEKAIRALKKAGLLNAERMHATDRGVLAEHIRPAGYFNVKALRLKNFLAHLFDNHSGSINRLFDVKNRALRDELLSINGIGPETADSIMLYAAGRPEFVVDAYTKRVLERHGLIGQGFGYEDVKALFMDALEADKRVFNEYHALIVRLGKDYCKSRGPLCTDCPLERDLKGP